MIWRTSGLTSIVLLIAAFLSANSFFVDYDETRIDRSPDVAVDAAGNAVIVWASQIPRGVQQLNGIRVRRIDREGAALGQEYRIDRLPGFLARNPAVDITPDGQNFVVVWEGGAEGKRSRRRVWARVFGADGQPVGPEIRVDQQPLTHELFGLAQEYFGGPRVSMAPSGEFVVVWRSEGKKSCDRFNISARRFSVDGKAMGDEFLVNEDASWSQLNPDIDHDSAGRFVVVWQDGRWIGTTEELSRIRGRIFGPAGEVFGPEFVLSRGLSGSAALPALAVSQEGAFVCVWKSWAGASFGVRLQARSFDPDSGQLGTQVEIEPISAGIGRPGTVLVDDRDFMIFWTDQDFEKPGGTHIRAQTFTRAGLSEGSGISLSPQTCADRSRPALAVAGNGVAIAAWQVSRSDGIEGRRFTAGFPQVSLPTPGLAPTLQDFVSDWRYELRDHRIDDRLREQAASHLRCMQGEATRAFDDLAVCLKDDEAPQVRAACAGALAAVADPPAKAIPHLQNSLVNDTEAMVRSAAAGALGDIGEDAVAATPVLMVALDDESSIVVSQSGLALGRIGAAPAINKLVKKLKEQGLRWGCEGIPQGLAELAGHREAFLGLRPVVFQCAEKVTRQIQADDEQYSLREFFRRHVAEAYPEDRETVDQAFKISKKRLADGRVGVFDESEEADREYFEWIDQLLLRYLDSREQRFRNDCRCLTVAASAIFRIDPMTEETASMFRELLGAAKVPVCQRPLLRIVEQMGARAEMLSGAVISLIGNKIEVRLEAIRTIAAIDSGSEWAVRALNGVINDPDPTVRIAVIEALILMNAEAIMDEKAALILRLEDDDGQVRLLAERALDLIEIEAEACHLKSHANPASGPVNDTPIPPLASKAGARHVRGNR